MIQFGMASMIFGGVEVGCLQNVSLDFNYSVAELYCGNGMFPSDVRVHSGKITGKAEFADITAVGLEKILGASRSNDDLTLSNTSKPSSFAMIVSLTTDAVTFSITFGKVRSTKLSMAFVRDGHLIPNFDFQVEADANGSVATIDVGDVS